MAFRLTQLLRLAAKPGGAGSGGKKITEPPQDWRWKVSGLTMKEMRHHYAIIPMHILTVVALSMAGAYVFRLASKHPEVSWTKSNSEPWNDYKNKRYKFVDTGRDWSNASPAPTYKGK